MSQTQTHAVTEFFVCPQHFPYGPFNVFERGFEHPIAQFDDMETAEQYAFKLAEMKQNWTIAVYDNFGDLAGTYNSEDDAMPKA